MNQDQDICRLTIHFRDSDEPLELTVCRQAIINFHRELNDEEVRFINMDGVGIPVDRIASYDEEDMEGKSVFTPTGFLGDYPAEPPQISTYLPTETITAGTPWPYTHNAGGSEWSDD